MFKFQRVWNLYLSYHGTLHASMTTYLYTRFYFTQKWKKIKRKKNVVHQFRELHWNKWIITKRVASKNVLWIHSKALLCVKCLKPDFVIKLIKRKYSFVENVWPIYDYQRTQQGKIFWTMNEVLFLLRKILNLFYI